ncbi:hypothetical protein BCR34DRAFT_569543 [Clohesyomyces aquaticus]|uniref:Threonyl/alanyl tRNA synthetase SAD domain-containing protein n=1 Tax=Clohesyomyces aquaticus TaxID=1231657 RepID=A0A1Y1ZFX6_9PLEO|nr:hypothetical protein BCR34DRAFT_569543 [Clohesyomyces aquaticus]
MAPVFTPSAFQHYPLLPYFMSAAFRRLYSSPIFHRHASHSTMSVAGPLPSIVGALRCQNDSYLQTLETEVVSCSEYIPPPTTDKSKQKKSTDPSKGFENGANGSSAKTWLLEFQDSVLFPEGGGQPTDHGSITPLSGSSPSEAIPITSVQRHGLRCIHFSSVPLTPGTPVLQSVDFARRWDHMQQHTGQHLLSAIMDSMSLETLSWTMGSAGEMNSIEIARKPSPSELALVQEKCNTAIRENHPITVETPSDAKTDSLPGDYDHEKGVVRVIAIGDLDRNPCCGTHLKQTSHIGLILLHHMQTIRGTNCRLYFSAGDRAIGIASGAIGALRSMSTALSCGNAPEEVQAKVLKMGEDLAGARRAEKKLLGEIAMFEGERVKAVLRTRKSAFSHRATGGLDFVNLVWTEVKEAAKEKGVVVLASGEGKAGGILMIVGQPALVESYAARAKEVISSVKGGGKGDKWQGKVVEWNKGDIEALRQAVEG